MSIPTKTKPPKSVIRSKTSLIASNALCSGRLPLTLSPRLPSLLTQADALREFGASRGIVRGDHRVVVRKPPLLSILLRRQAPRGQVPFHRLVGPAVLHRNDVVRLYRLLDRDWRL